MLSSFLLVGFSVFVRAMWFFFGVGYVLTCLYALLDICPCLCTYMESVYINSMFVCTYYLRSIVVLPSQTLDYVFKEVQIYGK